MPKEGFWMGFREFIEDTENTRNEAQVRKIAGIYHDIERDEVIDTIKPNEDFKAFFYRDDKIFKEMFEGDEDADKMIMMLNIFSETGGMDKLESIFEMMDGGEEISSVVKVIKTIKSMEKAFSEHYDSIAKEIVDYANKKGISAEDAVKKQRVRDRALKKVLKTKEDYLEYAKADVGYIKSIVGTIDEGFQEEDDARELTEIVAKLNSYHSERMDKLYKNKR